MGSKKKIKKLIKDLGNPRILTPDQAFALRDLTPDPEDWSANLDPDGRVVDAFLDRIGCRFSGPHNIAALSSGERLVLEVTALMGEVLNGGFHQYLWNSSGDFAEQVRSMLGDIGANRTAAMLNRVSEFFPDGRIPSDRLRKIIALLFLLLLMPTGAAIADDIPELRMSLADVFRLEAPADWKSEVKRYMPLRVADVKITPLRGYDFDMMLYFKCDTKDLARCDTPEKMAEIVKQSSEKYLPRTVEKDITLKPVQVKSTYGFYTVFTDAVVAGKAAPDRGEYKNLTRGMVRLTKDSALGFSVMTNDVDSEDYRKLLNYVYGFIKPREP